MKTVDELVSGWTTEEREMLKDLIEECREREEMLIEYSRFCNENLFKLTQSLSFLFSGLNELKETVPKLTEELWRIYLHLHKNKNMPSS
jgi:hypothetical protein